MEYSVDVVLKISVSEIDGSDFNNAAGQAKSLIYKKLFGDAEARKAGMFQRPSLAVDEYRTESVYKKEE